MPAASVAERSYEQVSSRHDRPRGIGAGDLRPAAASPTASCCRSSSRSRSTRPRLTIRAPTGARSTARRSVRRAAGAGRVARAYIAQLEAAHVFDRPIATRVDPRRAVLSGRGITRTISSTIPTTRTSSSTTSRRSRRCSGFSPRTGRPRRCWWSRDREAERAGARHKPAAPLLLQGNPAHQGNPDVALPLMWVIRKLGKSSSLRVVRYGELCRPLEVVGNAAAGDICCLDEGVSADGAPGSTMSPVH